MNDYETRRQEKAERYRELAEKNLKASEQTLNRARDMASVIPLGQPILVGHHSEKRHRNHLDRIHNTYGKGFELGDRAKYYAEKAAAAESNTTISSDDPEAVTKLKEKIAKAEASQETMRAFNKCLRKGDNAGMLALVGSQAMVDELSKPDFCGRVGFADYQLTNNSGNIRRMKERVAGLEKRAANTTNQITIGEITIIDNVEINRLQIIFPDKPSDEIRGKLKSNGFRWSPTEGAWQRHRSNWANHVAKDIVHHIVEGY